MTRQGPQSHGAPGTAGCTTCWEPRSCQGRPPASACGRRALPASLYSRGCSVSASSPQPAHREGHPRDGQDGRPPTAQPTAPPTACTLLTILRDAGLHPPRHPWSLPQRGLGIRPCVCPAVAWTASYSRGPEWHPAGPSPDLRGCPRAGATPLREPLLGTDTASSPMATHIRPRNGDGHGFSGCRSAALVRTPGFGSASLWPGSRAWARCTLPLGSQQPAHPNI